MDKEFSDFIFRQTKFLDYDKFKDFNVSLHGNFQDPDWSSNHMYSEYDTSRSKYHLWVVQSNDIFLAMFEQNIAYLKKHIIDVFPPKEETWNNKSLWVVIDRKTERLNYKSAIPLLDLLMEMGYNTKQVKFLCSSHEKEKILVGFTLELYTRAQYFKLSDEEFSLIYKEKDMAINHEYKGKPKDYKKWLLNLDNIEPRPYTFLNYNGTLPGHKLKLLSEIHNRNLEKYFLLSATNRDGDSIESIKEKLLYPFESETEEIPIDLTDNSKLLEKLPIYLDITSDMDSRLCSFKHGVYRSEIGNSNPKKIHYDKTYFSVISETSFNSKRLVGDPWKCMILHPFILNAGAYSLELFKSFGFKSFPNVFDESYDKIENPIERSKFIINEIERICLLSEEEKHQLYLDSIPILKYNQNHLCNFDLNNFLLEVFNEVVS